MAISSPGIGSNLDVNTIVSQLMALEQRPLAQLNQKEASFQATLSAFGSLKGAISAFQGSLSGLRAQSKFETLTARAADAAIFTATAASSAAPGSYDVTVSTLARAQVLNAAGMASATTASSTGSITLQVGSNTARTVTVSTENNTLEGVRDAINAAGAGVSAVIVNDGSAMPHRLALTATTGGLDNTITLNHTLSAGALKDALDGITEAQAAQDATLTVNGIAIASATNTIDGAIPGVTLRLLKNGATTLTVANDTAGIQSAVQAFVKGYNDLNKTIADLTAYDPATKRAGTLVGDSSALGVQAQMRAALSAAIPGLGGTRTTLSQIGITFQLDGSLALDTAKLSAALNAAPAEVGALFAARAGSDSNLVSYVRSGAASQPGSYQVHVASAATQGAATASMAAAATTLIDGDNDSLYVQVNGVTSGTVQIAHGSYNAAALAGAVQTALGGSAMLTAAGIDVAVGVTGGKIIITSDTYGSASMVGSIGGTAAGTLGYSGAESGTGRDIAGYFFGNGVKSAATGVGQELTAARGTAADGLVIRHTGTAAQLQAGAEGTVQLTEGYALRLDRLATRLLDTAGPITSRTSGLDRSIEDIARRRETFNRRMINVETRIRAQFTALDTLLGRLTSTSNFLSQQLANLPSATNSRN